MSTDALHRSCIGGSNDWRAKLGTKMRSWIALHPTPCRWKPRLSAIEISNFVVRNKESRCFHRHGVGWRAWREFQRPGFSWPVVASTDAGSVESEELGCHGNAVNEFCLEQPLGDWVLAYRRHISDSPVG